MSGGSYNYLSFRDFENSDLEAMADRLAELPYAEKAYRATQALVDALKLDSALRDVWHAVEWWDSGDTGEEPVEEACKKYEQIAGMESRPEERT